jgi:hypothetical protein
MLPHHHLAANGRIPFETLLACKQRLREAMRLKAVPCEIEGWINDEKPLVGKPLEAESSGMVAYVALTFWILFVRLRAYHLGGGLVDVGDVPIAARFVDLGRSEMKQPIFAQVRELP